MSVQKQKHTKGRRDRARKMLQMKKKVLVACVSCGKKIAAHLACPFCGYYRGREIKGAGKKAKAKTRS